jgi:signal transduction histidine kinase
MADNAAMSIDALRRLAARPDWPLISGLTLAALALVETTAYTLGIDDPEDSLAAVLNLLATVPLVWRRSRPIPVLVVVSFGALWIAVEPLTLTVSAVVGLGWATYSVAARSRRWVAVLLGLPFFVYAWGADNGAVAAALLAAVVFGFVVGNSRRLTSERDEAREQQAAMGERARIARELHDVVAHHISMIVVQADTARLATPGMPAEGAEKLLSIRATAREAMDELRRVLGVLRDDAGGDVEHAPQPGLDQLAELLDAARGAGTPVRLVVEGRATTLAAGVDLTAYRIVQEALTNARRHAPGAAVDVELRYGEETLTVSIRDTGPGAAATAEGHGLRGMRERAETVGGTLRTGPGEHGGFVVEAELPAA